MGGKLFLHLQKWPLSKFEVATQLFFFLFYLYFEISKKEEKIWYQLFIVEIIIYFMEFYFLQLVLLEELLHH